LGGFLEFFGKFGARRMAAMMAVTVVMVAFFGFVIFRVSQPAMSLLYSDLSSSDASSIIRELEARNIKYEIRGDGQTIMAAKNDVPRIRMELAGKGLPSGGGVGYEIFDKGDAFSSTSFVQNINHLRALEGELSRSIRAISRVQQARVHLVIPERRLFDRDREAPRASIALKLRGDLETSQVRAIRNLVASAVEGLKPERVSIVDEKGRLLADGAQSDQGFAGVQAEERQLGAERRIKAQIEDIVASVVGPGRARVQVNAELDLNRSESRSELFDPESRVVRSTQTRTENQQSTEGNGQVTVGNELPGAQGQQNNAAQREQTAKNEEVVNFEISKTTKTEVVEAGRLKKLSVAVLVDGTYAKGQNGEATYQPRQAEELERIGQLVRTAIGFDRARGDQVEIVNLRFAEGPAQVEFKEQTFWQQLFGFGREDMFRLIELGVIGLLSLIVLMTVVRPLMRQVLAPEKAMIAALPPQMQAMAQAAIAAGVPPEKVLPPPEPETPSERMLAMAQIKGQVKAQSLEKVGAMVKANPADSVGVIRSWIHEQPGGA
jgi:flagellar M-ring protein FliF